MSFNQKKRFIAGAVCPKCSEMDKIMVYNKEGQDYRECVSCGFSDEMHFKQQVRELDTRVNKTEEEKQADVQVLQFPPLDK
ncbi:MAG: hypothetical protein CL693_14455 [Cellvibrionaceae bacterium]|nr:hypothetical protein [Cellvibrionaceae bacterium]|tara:strand:- start:3331 stop:3573 length:243 start_codon:yes stop_codon:yes gene_type:complete